VLVDEARTTLIIYGTVGKGGKRIGRHYAASMAGDKASLRTQTETRERSRSARRERARPLGDEAAPVMALILRRAAERR